MTNYTDEQIRKAILKMPMMNLANDVAQWELELFRQFLNALPNQTDEWEECNYEDIKGTDQKVRAVYGDGVIIEGPVQEIYVSTVVLVGEHRLPRLQAAKYYRIPAPVVHPDPAEHPVIIVRSVAEPRAVVGGVYVWTGYAYVSIDGSVCYLDHTEITDWTPAKVIADE